MHAIPSLPAGGPLRLLAIAGSISLLAFFASAIILLRRRQMGTAGWAAAPLGMLVVSFGLGRIAPHLHPLTTAATFVLAGRNTLRFAGLPRALQALGLLTWLIAVLAARALFGR